MRSRGQKIGVAPSPGAAMTATANAALILIACRTIEPTRTPEGATGPHVATGVSTASLEKVPPVASRWRRNVSTKP
jgi:hypothetical protein